jgi:alkanesulfonate monooxygenase SsuD/methylene tetrahydromethanopterin reductase-like flavin-dependent oxidoreductase (luciferase family)
LSEGYRLFRQRKITGYLGIPDQIPKIGYLLPTREQIMEGRPETGLSISLSERAEAFGYDSVWIGDSLLARPRHEPLILLAGVAARTRRLQLGTVVLLLVLRNPVILAHQVATLDQLSEGRLILGVRIGLDVPIVHAEFEAAGVTFEKRAGRMIEGLALCRALWAGDPVEWDGRWRVHAGVLAPTTWNSK